MEHSGEQLRYEATKGDPIAQHNFALMYFKGEGGLIQSDEEAPKWWRMAGENGHQGSRFRLGSAFYRGQGTSIRFGEAAKWVLLAAEQGNLEAQYRLGLMYWRGEGFPRDLCEAYVWLNLAAVSHGDAKQERDDLGVLLSPSIRQLAERRSTALHKNIKLLNSADGVH